MDSLFESLLPSSPNDRAAAIETIEKSQEYLLSSVQHYGMALQLGQKHVYQALPRLLAMWLEFTSLCGEESDSEQDSKFEEKVSLVLNTAIRFLHLIDLRVSIMLSLLRQRSCTKIKN